MSDLSIQLNIAGRTYPLNIKREDEEGLRKAAKEIQEHIIKLKQSYAVKDSQDLLAMTLLEYASRLAAKTKEEGDEMSSQMLTEVDQLLDDLS